MSIRKIELLAPARDLACGRAAIDHGADAVYIGGPSFGARSAAGNSIADIEKLVQYAHLYFSKVYVALNTLLTDAELDPAVRQIHDLYNIGIDGLIIQDMGLLECDLPTVPLHASTQCNNRTPEKVRFLEQVGFEQIVLARELGLDGIREIRSATSAVLEFFVHGSLCVSYSGQCYISEVMTGRSANRGECAQFCRHAYQLSEPQGKIIAADEHVLSLKDLNLSKSLEPLLDAGIDSFKIEGRLKGEQYVKNVTAFYRRELDTLLTRRTDIVSASSGQCAFGFNPDPSRSFNRGATEYYLNVKKGRPGSTKTPKSTGQYVGDVTAVDKKSITISGKEQLNNGDGCCYFNENDQLIGFLVNKVVGKVLYPARPIHPPLGTRLFRNVDTDFNKLLGKSEACRTIKVDLELVDIGTALRLIVRDEDDVVSQTDVAIERIEAKKQGVAEQMAERQLRKSGASLFTVQDVKVVLDSDLFIPASVCNALRRDAFETHLGQRVRHYGRRVSTLSKNEVPWLTDEVGFRDNILNSRAHDFYRRHGVISFEDSVAAIAEGSLMHSKYCVRAQYGLCTFNKKTGENAEPLIISDKTGNYKLTFICDRCEMTVTRLKGTLTKEGDVEA